MKYTYIYILVLFGEEGEERDKINLVEGLLRSLSFIYLMYLESCKLTYVLAQYIREEI